MGKPIIRTVRTSNLRKQIGQMAKLMGVWRQSRVKTDEYGIQTKSCVRPVINVGQPSFLTNIDKLDSKHISRRQIVLNRHFTEVISDVLSMDLRKELLDSGVRITSIETHAWIGGIGIYYTMDKPYDEELHATVDGLSKHVIKYIAQRNLVGRVPMIRFIFDRAAEAQVALDRALIDLPPDLTKESKTLQQGSTNALRSSKPDTSRYIEEDVRGLRFSGPRDMDNCMSGLNYPSLYNEVVEKQTQGRGASGRMINPTVLAKQQPLYQAPIPNDNNEGDARDRVMQMHKFLVSQRKKSEMVAQKVRKAQLLSRDAYLWDKEADEDKES